MSEILLLWIFIGLGLLAIGWELYRYVREANEPDYLDRPASHAVAHAEGWPCPCKPEQR